MSKERKHTTFSQGGKGVQQKFMLSFFWVMELFSQTTLPKVTHYWTLLNKSWDVLKKEHCNMLTRGVCLLANNAPAPSSWAVAVEARWCAYEILLHLFYSHDLTLSVLFLFPETKNPVWNQQFSDRGDIIREKELVFNAIWGHLQWQSVEAQEMVGEMCDWIMTMQRSLMDYKAK